MSEPVNGAAASQARSGEWRWAGRGLLTGVVALTAALALFELTDLDLWVQDHFYDFAAGRWIVDGHAPVGRLVFYQGPKVLLFAVGALLLALALGPARWRKALRCGRRSVWIALLTLGSVPALVGWGKATTNVFCPSEIRRYGGDVPYVRVFESYPAGDRPARRGRGFPAGHASGGFALIGLLWLRGTRRWRAGVIILALGAGWWMGGYQMLKGAHYLSHTVVTMLLAGLIALAWRLLLLRRADKREENQANP